MSGDRRVFVDTNVLLYSVDPSETAKRNEARRWLKILWETGRGSLSWQVLNEFYVNAIRKIRTPSQKASQVVQIYATWTPVEVTFGLIQRAWHWMDQAQMSYWDAMIVAAAERAGCDILLTEDLQTGRRLGRVEVVNPFDHSPSDFGFPSVPPPLENSGA